MALLKKATVEQAAAKIGIFGGGGSGKSLTSMLIALGASQTYHKGAPIAMLDTEAPASDWLVDLCDTEGVDLLRHKGRSFVDMRTVLREAHAAGACALLVDTYSHPWVELQESLKKRLNVKKLEIHHNQELQELWQEWVREFMASPLHIILSGRLANEWETDVDEETGKTGFHKVGTKMRSEKDAGYEPHLLIEMEAQRVMDVVEEIRRKNARPKTIRKSLKAGGHFIHHMHVLKDRSRTLNGKMFEFKDMNAYKKGDWKTVFGAVEPHFAKLAISSGTQVGLSERTSAALFSDRGDSAYQQRIKRVQIVLEELQGTLVKLWPGQDAKSKALKALAIEVLFETRSWTAVESKSLERLDARLDALKLFEEQTEDGAQEALTEAPAATLLLKSCLDKVEAEAQHARDTVGIL